MSSYPSNFDSSSPEELECLRELLASNAIVQPDDPPYDPMDPEVETQLTILDHYWSLIPSPSMDPLAQAFDRHWEAMALEAAIPSDPLPHLVQNLPQLPQAHWETILETLSTVMDDASLSLIEQLATLIAPLFPQWHREDLLVLAHPYGATLRSNPCPTDIGTSPEFTWDDLQDLDKIRLSLVAARLAIQWHRSQAESSDF